jgi:hypothetical protein
MIEKVIIEINHKCEVCHWSVSDIIKILKRHGVPYVTRVVGDDYASTYEFHQIQPSVSSMYQNITNIQNPELRDLLLKGHPIALAQLEAFLRGVLRTPRIYIYLRVKDGMGKEKEHVLVLNGVVVTKEWFEKFEELIELLQNLDEVYIPDIER